MRLIRGERRGLGFIPPINESEVTPQMYCPKCGQSQVNAEVRFCSRCGFPLVVVGDLLLTGGALPVRAAGDEQVSQQPQPMSRRRRGVKRGIGILLFSIFLVPFFLILHEALGLPAEFAVLGAIGGMVALLRIIFAVFFEDGAPAQRAAQVAPAQLYTPPQMFAPRTNHAAAQETLPPAQAAPVNDYRRPRVDTSEIMHPPSVTDHTTRLLEKHSDPSER